MKKNIIKSPNDYYKSIEEILPHIWHIRFSNRYWMCATIMRYSEFVESNTELILKKKFTYEQFMDFYAEQHNWKFRYFEDWAGFNLSKTDIKLFQEQFRPIDLLEKEKVFWHVIEKIKYIEKTHNFEIITTDSNNTLIHEIAHALYNINPKYQLKVLHELGVLEKKHPYLYRRVYKDIIKSGYNKEVIYTELNSYICDYTCPEYILEELNISVTGYNKLSRNLVKLFKEYYNEAKSKRK